MCVAPTYLQRHIILCSGLPVDPPKRRMPPSLYRYIWRTQRRDQITLSIVAVLAFPLSMAPLELQRRIIDNAIADEDIRLLAVLAAIYLGAVLVQGCLKYLLNTWRGHASESMIRRLRRQIHEEVTCDKPTAPDSGRAIAMATEEIERLGGFAGEALSTPILQAGVLASVLGYMVVVEPVLALAGIGLFIPQMILVPKLQEMINRRSAVRTRALRGMSESLSDGEQNGFERSRARIDWIYRLRMAIFRLKAAMKVALNLFNHAGEIAVLVVGGILVIRGGTEIGTVVAFLSGLQRIRQPWRDLITYYRQASDARVKYHLIGAALQG